jgi:hypothetical protein
MKPAATANLPPIRWPGLIVCALMLTNCGFVTAPLALASAEVASSTVKAADYGLEQGRTAAIYVRNQGSKGARVTAEFLGTMVDDMRDSLRVHPRPAQQAIPTSSQDSD